MDNGQVTFTLKNYVAAGQREQMSVKAIEFIRRFLLHVLGFTRIRHFGLSAGRNVKTKLQTARAVLTAWTPATPQPSASATAEKDARPWWQRLLDRTGIDILACPSCRRGRLVRCGEVQPFNPSPSDLSPTWLCPNDTS